jgi:uncharacterized protein YbjT (DUF2867 family)
MNIAITTPTGHVGGAAANCLLDCGGYIRVKLLGRRPEKLRNFTARGAELAIGSLDDANFLVEATNDVDALFWVTPPGYGSDNLRAYQNRLGRAAATAIRANRIPRVVNLSSLGAENSSGVGPIGGLHDVEEWIDDVAVNVVHLRPGFFFENLLWHWDSIKNCGRFSWPVSGTRRYPMIATRDIGRQAAVLLTDENWNGHRVRELHGPADLSPNDAAGIMSEVLGRQIEFVQCDQQEARQAMLDNAMSENAADMLLEMYAAFESGKLRPLQPRTPETTTPTTLAEFVAEVMVPMYSVPMLY